MRIFISYRSSDSNFARMIAEHLETAGIATWFSETAIRLKDSPNWVDEKLINEQLINSVKKCDHAIIITNNEWLDSPYCNTEAKAICDIISLSNIVEIAYPRTSDIFNRFPLLSSVKSIIHQGDNHSILHQLNNLFGITDIKNSSICPPSGRRERCDAVTFDPGPFHINKQTTQLIRKSHPDQYSKWTLYEAMVEGQALRLHLYSYIDESVVHLGAVSVTDDDAAGRVIQNRYREYALNHASQNALEDIGTHTFFLPSSGISHFMFTYISNEDPIKGTMWERRVVINLPGPFGSIIGEVDFLFSARLHGDKAIQRRDFFMFCQIFNQIISSIEIDTKAIPSQQNVLATLAMRKPSFRQALSEVAHLDNLCQEYKRQEANPNLPPFSIKINEIEKATNTLGQIVADEIGGDSFAWSNWISFNIHKIRYDNGKHTHSGGCFLMAISILLILLSILLGLGFTSS